MLSCRLQSTDVCTKLQNSDPNCEVSVKTCVVFMMRRQKYREGFTGKTVLPVVLNDFNFKEGEEETDCVGA